jgi:hypothetical protein
MFGSVCQEPNLGQFIITTPIEISPSSTSIFTAAVRFPSAAIEGAESINEGPFKYAVNKTGYYCVGAVPLSTEVSGDDYNSVSGSYYSVITHSCFHRPS